MFARLRDKCRDGPADTSHPLPPAAGWVTLGMMRTALLALLAGLMSATAGAQTQPPSWPPVPTTFVDLEYPPAAVEGRLAGRVIVHARVDAEGRVITAEALAGPLPLATAAVENLRQWTYPPGTGDVYTVYRFEFSHGYCNDNRRSLFQLMWSNLAVVTTCNQGRGGVIPMAPYHEVEFDWSEVLPVYNPIAHSARIQGIVIVKVAYDRRGRVQAADAVSGNPLLTDGAIRHARTLKFFPNGPTRGRRSSWLVYEFNQVKHACSATDYGMQSTDYLIVSACGPLVQVSKVSEGERGR